jgi:hypothetical protein
MDPGVKALGVEKYFSFLELMSRLDHVDNLYRHTFSFGRNNDLSAQYYLCRRTSTKGSENKEAIARARRKQQNRQPRLLPDGAARPITRR